MHVVNGPAPAAPGVTDWWLVSVAGALAFSVTGAWLAIVRPRLVVGWLMLAMGALGGVTTFGLEYGVWALERPGGAPLDGQLLWIANWTWVVIFQLFGAVLLLLLPDGRLPSPRWRLVLAVGIASVVVQAVTWALRPYEADVPALVRAGASNPLGVQWMIHPGVNAASGVLAVGAVLIAIGSLVMRWRTSAGDTRQQLKWIILGAAASVLLFAAGFVAGPVFTALAMLPLPAAIVVAVLRHGLWSVDVVLSRSLLYGSLTTAVVVSYVACVALIGGAIGQTTGASLVAATIVALCAEPLHRRLRTLVNRIVYGESEDPIAVLSQVGRRLEGASDAATVADQVLPDVVRAVAGALRLPYVAIALADGSILGHGTPTGQPVAIPLDYAGSEVGRLLVCPRTGGLARSDRRLLDELAGAAAVAARTVMLTRDLARSRAGLVAAREEERRRLYRELHDGLGPSLAAVALHAETARDLVGTDPAGAATLLDRVVPQLKGTVGDVRQVVAGLRPPALDELGLAGALQELGARFSGPALRVSVQVDVLPALPAAVEVGVYRVVAEALGNATRHAWASRVDVRVRRDGDWMSLSVVDDGVGLPAEIPSGTGLPSMRERVAELGGTFDALPGADAHGTRVCARLPVVAR